MRNEPMQKISLTFQNAKTDKSKTRRTKSFPKSSIFERAMGKKLMDREERQRKKERATNTETEIETDRERKRETDRQTDRQTDRDFRTVYSYQYSQ